MKDFSICLAHRGDPSHLWFTVMSIENELAKSPYDYEYCIAINGEQNYKGKKYQVIQEDLHRVLHYLHKSGKLTHATVKQASVTPQAARQIASDKATGKYLFFFDNHCLVEPDYFGRAIAEFENRPIDLLHSTTRFHMAEELHYHYKLKLNTNFWAESSFNPPINGLLPYRCAAGGHGGFAVRNDVWKEVEGYKWSTQFQGYAGEEIYCDVLMGMMDKQVWLSPHMIHDHWAGKRGYARHYTQDFYRNLLSCAYILGDEKYMYKVYDTFVQATLQKGVKMYDILQEAYYRSIDARAWVKQRAVRTLDEQIEYYRRNGIAH